MFKLCSFLHVHSTSVELLHQCIPSTRRHVAMLGGISSWHSLEVRGATVIKWFENTDVTKYPPMYMTAPWTKIFSVRCLRNSSSNMLSSGEANMNKSLPSKGSQPRCNFEIPSILVKLTQNHTGYFHSSKYRMCEGHLPLPAVHHFLLLPLVTML